MVPVRMQRPGPPLDEVVDCFWMWDGYPAPEPRERALPSGALELVVNLEEDRLRFFADDEQGSLLELPGATLSGAHAGYFVIGTSPHTSTVGVHFKPGGASAFLDLPSRDLEGRHVPLEALWGAAARRLRQRLLEAPPGDARFDVLRAFLLERARRPLQCGVRLKAALSAFEDPALPSVAEVNRRVGLSPKQLIALFRERVGLTPKAYWRVRRFQAALSAVDAGVASGAELALRLGYFDQAHLDREFRHFTGLSPRAYRAHRIERPHHVRLRG